MKKITLSSRNFNVLKRDPNGPKVQRIWTNEFHGLGIDLGKTKKSIIYRFKSPVTGKFRLLTLDSFSYEGAISDSQIDDIEEDYYRLRREIRTGNDPLQEKENHRAELKQIEIEEQRAKEAEKAEIERRSFTINKAFDIYTVSKPFVEKLAEGTKEAYLACYKNHVGPKFGKMPICDIQPKMVYDFLAEKSSATCNMSIVILKRLQKIALQRGEVTAPFVIDPDRATTGTRDSIIEDIPAFIDFVTDNKFYTSLKNAMYMQLLTGTRANEIYGLKWSEVDTEEGILKINWERVKNRRKAKQQFHPLIVPILPAMEQILEQQKGFSDTYVFQMLTKDEAVTNSVVYPFLKRNGFDFSSHDIRRTVATKLHTFKDVSVDDIDLVLDHSITGVNASYIHGTPIERKRIILSKWHTYLFGLVNDGITTIKSASGGVK